VSYFDGAIGAMADHLLKGEAVDVAIVSGEQIGRLIAAGQIDAAGRAVKTSR
jgi:hypothetical protein